MWLLGGVALLVWLAAFGLAQQVRQAPPAVQDPAVLVAQPPPPVIYDEVVSAFADELAHNHQLVAPLAGFFAVAGSVFVLLPLTVAVVVGLARRGHGWWAAWVAACGMGGWIISQSVKHIVDRPRPVWPDPFVVLSTPSFPSGHAMAGIYGYVVFGIVALALLPRRWPGVSLIVFGVLMGPSRVLLGVHWPTDVLGGWLLATGWVCATAAVLFALRDHSDRAATPGPARS